MDNDLAFVCNWDKDRAKTWSGTPIGLYNALSDHFNILDIDVGTTKKDFFTCLSFLLMLRNGLFKTDFDIAFLKLLNKGFRIDKQLKKTNIPVIEFFEAVNTSYPCKKYLYQDINLGYVKFLLDNQYDIFSITGFQYASKKSIYKREIMQRKYMENIDGFFAMGKWYANYLVHDYNIPSDKVFHVGGGINLDPELINYKSKRGNRILFVGRDFKRKNGELVVNAFKLLKKRIKDAELYIAGPRNLKIKEDGIFLLGDCPSSKLYYYFNLCDVFCMPSLFEAYGLVFIEALVYGLPCIGRNAYEMPYFINDGETGYLLKNNSSEELADLMEASLNNIDMQRNVRSLKNWYIEEYSWKTVANRIAKKIRQ